MLGFLISFRHTIIRISLVMTLAGGMAVGLISILARDFGCNSVVELEPSFDSIGPSRSTPFCLFPKLNSSRRYSS